MTETNFNRILRSNVHKGEEWDAVSREVDRLVAEHQCTRDQALVMLYQEHCPEQAEFMAEKLQAAEADA